MKLEQLKKMIREIAKKEMLKEVDPLIAKKKKLYSDVDITTPKSSDEKKLDKEIADLFSEINALVHKIAKLKKSQNEGRGIMKEANVNWKEFYTMAKDTSGHNPNFEKKYGNLMDRPHIADALKKARDFNSFLRAVKQFESVNEAIAVGKMVKVVDNPYWEAALGKKGPFKRKVKMIDGDNVFFTDGSNSSMKYVKEDTQLTNEADLNWNAVQNAIINFLKTNTKILDKKVQSKDIDGVKGGLKSILSGLTNAQRSLKLESASRTAMEIGGLTGLNKDVVQKFVDTHNLDIEKVFQFVKKGKLSDRMDFVTAVSSPILFMRKNIIKKLQESVNEEKYSDQTGIKSSLLNDSEFTRLFQPKVFNWIRGKDVKIFKVQNYSNIFTISDGNMEIVVNISKPVSVIKPYGRARREVKDLFSKTESVNEAKKYDIGSGYLGNGLTIWNRAEKTEDDNYETIAHIGKDGKLTIYDKEIPADIKKMIGIWATSMKKGNRPGSY